MNARSGKPHHIEPLERRTMLAVASAGAVTLDDIPDWAGRADGSAVLNGDVYFARYQSDFAADVEIWKSDGTPAGTTRLATTFGQSGSASSTGAVPSVRDFVAAGDRVYFTVDDVLWISDGTAAGTKQWLSPYNLWFGNTANAARKIVAVGDAAYVAAGGEGLYRIDQSGTPPKHIYSSFTTTDLVLCGGAAYFVNNGSLYKITGETSWVGMGVSGINSPIAVTNGRMYFSKPSSTNNAELWTSDGTTTVKAATLPLFGGAPAELTGCGGAAYFTIAGALWRSDGTAAGTGVVFDSNPNASDDVAALTAVGDTLYFRARDGANTTDLYRTDGTAAGAVRVTFINLIPSEMSAGADGKLYFSGLASDGAGTELWTSDGIAAGTVRLSDVNPGLLSGIFGKPIPTAGGTVVFHGVDPVFGAGMFTYDATAPRGATVLCDYNPGLMNARIDFASSSDGSMFYAAPSGYSTNLELFRADGSPNGAKLLKEIYTNTRFGSDPKQFYNVNGTMYFVAGTLQSGRELWKSDGTAGGTAMVKEMSSRQSSTQFSSLFGKNNLFYFDADTQGSGSMPSGRYQTDGTDAGTIAAPNGPRPPIGTAGVSGLIATAPSGWTYFADYTSFNLYLKRTKGSVTQTVGTWSWSSASSSTRYPREISFVRDKVVFAAMDNTYGAELWAYSETTGQTTLLKNFIPDGGGQPVFNTSGDPEEFFVIGDWVYFTATDNNQYGRELWRTDGTVAGTHLFADLSPGQGWSSPFAMGMYGGKQLLWLDTPETGRELWVTDGTLDGTHVLRDINPGPADAGIQFVIAGQIEGRQYFTADDGVHGRELWTTDGTAGGTLMVADIAPGALGSNPMNVTNVNGVLWFTANDGVTPQWFRVAPPAASVAATYAVSPGWHITLNGTGATTVDPNETLSYAWDLDGDGAFGETGAAATRGNEADAAVTFQTTGITFGTAIRVALRVSDSTGLATTATTTVTVDDLPGVTLGDGARYTLVDVGGQQSLKLGGGEIVVASNLGAALPKLNLNVELGGLVTIAAPQTLEHLTVEGQLAVAAGGANVILTRGLSFGHDGQLDLADNDLVLDYDPGATTSPLADVEGRVAAGYNHLAWDGLGLVTRMDGARQGVTTLAVAEAANVLFIGATETTLWNGVPVDGTAVLVKYTYTGDLNLDGLIDGADYGIIDNYVQFPGTDGYANGDFNYDGLIDGADYGLIDNAIQLQGEAL